MSSKNHKPLILLDVDGVLNANGRKSRWWNDAMIIEHLEAIYPNGEVKDFRIVFSPTVIDSINKWGEIAEIRWLTSWDERADRYLAPALGLNHFELGRKNDEIFKLDAVLAACNADPERLVIWIDDQLPNFRGDFEYKDPYKKNVFKRKNTVLLAPVNGLIKEHLEFMERILKYPASVKNATITKFDEGPHREGGCVIS